MYIKSDDTEKDLIEQAIEDAKIARNQAISIKISNLFAGLKAWLTALLDTRKPKGNASSSSDAPLMS